MLPKIEKAQTSCSLGTHAGHEDELLGGLRGAHQRLECLLVTLNEDSDD